MLIKAGLRCVQCYALKHECCCRQNSEESAVPPHTRARAWRGSGLSHLHLQLTASLMTPPRIVTPPAHATKGRLEVSPPLRILPPTAANQCMPPPLLYTRFWIQPLPQLVTPPGGCPRAHPDVAIDAGPRAPCWSQRYARPRRGRHARCTSTRKRATRRAVFVCVTLNWANLVTALCHHLLRQWQMYHPWHTSQLAQLLLLARSDRHPASWSSNQASVGCRATSKSTR